jgi:hypothetical protein
MSGSPRPRYEVRVDGLLGEISLLWRAPAQEEVRQQRMLDLILDGLATGP